MSTNPNEKVDRKRQRLVQILNAHCGGTLRRQWFLKHWLNVESARELNEQQIDEALALLDAKWVNGSWLISERSSKLIASWRAGVGNRK